MASAALLLLSQEAVVPTMADITVLLPAEQLVMLPQYQSNAEAAKVVAAIAGHDCLLGLAALTDLPYLSALQHCVCEVSPLQICALQIGGCQVGTMEIGPLGQCPEEGHAPQVGLGEVGLPQLPLGVCILCEVLV